MENKFIKKTLRLAEEAFTRREYKEAMTKYSTLLRKYPSLEDARVGVILSDMANESESEAQALFDYYTIVKKESPESATEIIDDLIKSFDGSMDQVSSLLKNLLSDKLEDLDGINYEEFKLIVKAEGDFKRAFENIMFSTKIIINNKSDFFAFIHDLIVNEFYEVALNYLEGIAESIGDDDRVRELFIKLKAIVGDSRSK